MSVYRMIFVIFCAWFLSAVQAQLLAQDLGSDEINLTVNDGDLDEAAMAATAFRFAYFATGDAAIDRITQQGLQGVTDMLINHTALEPADAMALDLDTADLTPEILIYWVVTENTPLLKDHEVKKLNHYMQSGGMLIIDTRDGERVNDHSQTPEQQRLARILAPLELPLLAPLAEDHVLKKSYYLLPILQGRNDGGLVWVESAQNTQNDNDNVTPVIIGGRDWAAAWARNSEGSYSRPMGSNTQIVKDHFGYEMHHLQRRTYAMRTGVNMAMVALTGNYKQDQLHVTAFLDRLGLEDLGLEDNAPSRDAPNFREVPQ